MCPSKRDELTYCESTARDWARRIEDRAALSSGLDPRSADFSALETAVQRANEVIGKS